MSLQRGQLADGNGKAADGEAEDDDRGAGAHPVQKRALVGQMVARPVGLGFGSVTSVALPPALFHSLGDHGAGAGQILDQVGGHVVPVLQVFGIVVGHGGLAVCILGH